MDQTKFKSLKFEMFIKLLTRLTFGVLFIFALFFVLGLSNKVYAQPVPIGMCKATLQGSGSSAVCVIEPGNNKCEAGKEAKLTGAPACLCACVTSGSPLPSISGPAPGGPGGTPGVCDGIEDALFGDGDCSLKGWSSWLLKYMIGFGFVYAVIMTPYIFFLFGTGDPNNIKKAKELINSIVYGLIMLAFSATIVSVLGGGILQI